MNALDTIESVDKNKGGGLFYIYPLSIRIKRVTVIKLKQH